MARTIRREPRTHGATTSRDGVRFSRRGVYGAARPIWERAVRERAKRSDRQAAARLTAAALATADE